MLDFMAARKTSEKLDSYRKKREPGRTPEPFGGTPVGSQRFVVQLHAARARHYDFRLEWGGVLLSWAVPKGPSPNPADKRLAVHVEDHPVDYVNFEGVIPAGNYGAGAVVVWDRGRWLPLKDPEEGFEQGKFLFELRGYKLRGRWTLVKTRRSPKDWLLIKENDAYVDEGGTDVYPADSVLSGLTVEQLKAAEHPGPKLTRGLKNTVAIQSQLDPSQVKPMLAKPGKPFDAEDWLFELKYDGYRIIASRAGGDVKLTSRNGHDLTLVFPEIADVVSSLPFEHFILDGEAVVHDEKGLPSFARLQRRGKLTRQIDVQRASVELPATLYLFDILALEGWDLRPLPLVERKDILKQLLPSVGPLKYSDHIDGAGIGMFDQVNSMGLEGIVGKRRSSAYTGKRSDDWIKVNALRSDDFAIVGFSEAKGASRGVGAVLLAQMGSDGLTYVGRVGTGFSHEQLAELDAYFKNAAPAAPPVRGDLESSAGKHWVEANRAMQVRFKNRTTDGLLRQPVFMYFRDDKAVNECLLPEAGDGLPEPAPIKVRNEREVKLTNQDKVFWPEEGYTKGDLVTYYQKIADWILPYLTDRPLVLTRYPDGIDGKSFFQKDAPVYVPDWLRLETMWSEQAEREIRYFIVEDVEALTYIANMGAIPLHVWSSRVSQLQHPDWCILDLDPKGAPFADVVTIARELHRLCDDIGLPNFVKTSGSSGWHVLVPLGGRYSYEQSRTLAELLARCVVKAMPKIATIRRVIEAREGKVYIDYLQNGHGRLLVAPFCVRPLPGAPVSMPLSWSQVNRRLRLSRFTIKTAPGLMMKAGLDPLLDVMAEPASLSQSLEKLAERL